MLMDSDGATVLPDKCNGSLSSDRRDRFRRQIEFILEIDKLKNVLRKTILMDRSRRENSAEHSWHIALTVLIMSEYAKDSNVDLFRVMKILLVHDIIEIDAGDTYCYDDQGRKDQSQREKSAADRIFNLLPADQASMLRKLWDEFEERKTPESKFANAMDRLQPFLHNYYTEGQIWQENNITSAQVKSRMDPVDDGAPILWHYVRSLIDDGIQRGYLAE
ncbi:MAG: HD domain-containing protein [Desulfobacterales bacterium]|jgi:putative hydrolase of HD superfamily